MVTTWAKNGDLKTYINGALVSGATTSAGANDLEDTQAIPFAIGVESFNKADTTTQIRGNIWACGLWDVELTADEISDLYNGSTGGVYADYTWT